MNSNVDLQWCLKQFEIMEELTRVTGRKYSVMPFDPYSGKIPKLDQREVSGSRDEIMAHWPKFSAALEACGFNEIQMSQSSLADAANDLHAIAVQAKNRVLSLDEIQEKVGDSSPRITAASLHPWVWESAKSRWNTNHKADAVSEVGKRIKDELENKANRHLGETEQVLFNNVFGKESVASWSDLDSEERRKERIRALRSAAEFFYAGIRNTLAHKSGVELSDQEALEWLAVASRIANWIDEASL